MPEGPYCAIAVPSSHAEEAAYLFREELVNLCGRVEAAGLEGQWHAAAERCADLFALFGRLVASLAAGQTTLLLAEPELPAFRAFVEDALLTEGQERAAEPDGDVLTVVASATRVELLEHLADQIGGLLAL